MEKFLLHLAKIVGTPTTTSGSWVHTFSPFQEEKLSKRGHFLATIGLTEFAGPEEIAAVGKEMISRLQEEYYGDLEPSVFAKLKKAVDKVSQEAKEGTGFKLDLGAVVLLDKALYAVVNGRARLMINRDGKIRTLLSQTETLSGYWQNGDLFLLGTEDFFRLVDDETLNLALKAQTPQEAVEILAPLVHGQQDGGAAAIVFQVVETNMETKETVKPEMKINFNGLPKERRSFDLLQKLKGQIVSLIEKSDEKIKKKLIYLRANKEKSAKPQKTLMFIALALVVILIIAVFLGMKQRKNLGVNSQSSNLLQQAQLKKEEGEGLLNLNPTKSRQLLLEAQDLVSQIESSGFQTEELARLKEELEHLLGTTLKEYQVEGSLFFDLGIVKAEGQGDHFVLSDGQIIVLDKKQNSLYKIGIQEKKSAILAGGEKIDGASFLTDLNGKIYVLAKEGIYRIDKSPELKIKKDEGWDSVLDLGGFGGYLYLLTSKGIWKYPPTEEGFGTKQPWLKQDFDLSQTVKMAIDGSIWLLGKEGRILKFTRGVQENFAVTGLNKPLLETISFYTNADLKNLYLLDRGNSRVVVLSKLGEYQAEYLWSGASDASDLLVDSDEGQIFLLSGDKIFTIKLK